MKLSSAIENVRVWLGDDRASSGKVHPVVIGSVRTLLAAAKRCAELETAVREARKAVGHICTGTVMGAASVMVAAKALDAALTPRPSKRKRRKTK